MLNSALLRYIGTPEGVRDPYDGVITRPGPKARIVPALNNCVTNVPDTGAITVFIAIIWSVRFDR